MLKICNELVVKSGFATSIFKEVFKVATRRYRVDTTVLDPRYTLNMTHKGFECVSLKLARMLIRRDIQRVKDKYPNVDLEVQYGVKDTVILCDGKEVINFHLTYVGTIN